ncbi:MAG: hypothetical protein EYX74_05565 [Desulfobulbaceae bacterium]|nr:MAG: hypothetical protein EYX74_05565 [Desulfobulbaceae bacterium]
MAHNPKSKIIGKCLCKLAKNTLRANAPPSYKELVADGKYLCRKCGRVAKCRKNICKAESI